MMEYEYIQANERFDYVAPLANRAQEQGWELIATFNRGNFVTVVFRRPKK